MPSRTITASFLKLGVTTVVVYTAGCAALLASSRSAPWYISPAVLNAMIGIGLAAAGTAGLNEVIERDLDARMRRTSERPLVKGTMTPAHAGIVCTLMVLGGSLYLAVTCNWLSAALTFLTAVAYLCVYTPLKTRSSLCTLVGAVPGAMPPLLGWVAVRGALSWEAFVLFAIVYFWQFPHFHSIALLHRDDYARAGIRMLPVVEPDGHSTSRSILANSIALLAVTAVPVAVGIVGIAYAVVALVLGSVLVYFAIRLWQCITMNRSGATRSAARKLLLATVIYLPALFSVLVVSAMLRGL